MAVMREGMDRLGSDRLRRLMGHADMRVRQEAQFALAATGLASVETLAGEFTFRGIPKGEWERTMGPRCVSITLTGATYSQNGFSPEAVLDDNRLVVGEVARGPVVVEGPAHVEHDRGAAVRRTTAAVRRSLRPSSEMSRSPRPPS